MHHIVIDEGVALIYIHQVEKNIWIKPNWRFTIKIVSCCSLIDRFNATHTLTIHFNKIWTRGWNFCGWSFHSQLNSRRWWLPRNVTELHCYWSTMKPFKASNFVSKLIFVITSLYLFVWFHFWHSFPIHSSSTNPVKAFVEKLDDKGWSVEEIVKENGAVRVFKVFCLDKNSTGSKVLFSAFFFTQVHVKLVQISCVTLTGVQKFKPPFYWFILHILPHTWSSLKFDYMFIKVLSGNNGNTDQKTVTEVTYYRSNFIGLVNSFVLLLILLYDCQEKDESPRQKN